MSDLVWLLLIAAGVYLYKQQQAGTASLPSTTGVTSPAQQLTTPQAPVSSPSTTIVPAPVPVTGIASIQPILTMPMQPLPIMATRVAPAPYTIYVRNAAGQVVPVQFTGSAAQMAQYFPNCGQPGYSQFACPSNPGGPS